MCGTSPTDDLALIPGARRAADELLLGLGVPVRKAFEVATPRGFDAAVSRLAALLRRLARVSEVEAVRQAVAVLDVDWRAMTAAQRSQLVRRALASAGRAVSTVHQQIRAPLGRAASDVVAATRSDGRRRGLAIAADFNAVDRRAVAYVVRANSLFVRDEYGRRLDWFGIEAKRVVARGLEDGLGRDEIAGELARAANAAMVQRPASYWDVIASSFVGESRSLSQISSYAEAGIERYMLSAVLDEHTTDTCRFLDGKVLQTDDAIRMLDRMESSDEPAAIKQIRPWVRERFGEDGKRTLVVHRDGERNVLAVVERSGVGARDDRGAYSRAVSGRDLAPAGIGFPPFHGLCRTTTVADV